MNRYTTEPIEPFYVQAKTAKCSVSSGLPPAGGGSAKSAGRMPSPFAELETATGRFAVGFCLAATYFLTHQRPMFSALSVLLLLGALMYRLDPHRRRIAAAPITLSTAMLVSQIAARDINDSLFGRPPAPGLIATGAEAWIPLFLAACLFYAPNFRTNTEKILMFISLFVLGSGLLPGGAFVAIFTMVEYFLFIAVAVGLGIDFIENGNRLMPSTQSS